MFCRIVTSQNGNFVRALVPRINNFRPNTQANFHFFFFFFFFFFCKLGAKILFPWTNGIYITFFFIIDLLFIILKFIVGQLYKILVDYDWKNAEEKIFATIKTKFTTQ
jgi:hypothetical protein